MAYTTINKPSQYFNTLLWTGNGNSTRSLTGVGFKPDWVWIKSRSGAYSHHLFDIVRGVEKALQSNSSNAESNQPSSGYLTAFNSDGFSVSQGSFSATNVNENGTTYVSWNWLGANTTVSNTSGTITSTVSANTTAGFSIATYTGNGTSGATVGHGLGVAPSMIILKSRSNSGAQWAVYHQSLGNTKALQLDATNAAGTSAAYWNNTSPTSTVFSLGNGTDPNENTGTYVAYCFAEVKGFSKFGSYTGNGSDDGTFVYTGFKPAFLMAKRTDSTGYWYLWDSVRKTFNYNGTVLFPNDTSAESSYVPSNPVVDFLSNGFKLRGSYPEVNASGGTFIYMAFAENPFVSSTFIPTTAR
jgi:hypothetical protein